VKASPATDRFRSVFKRIWSSEEDLVDEESADESGPVGAQAISSVKARERVGLFGEIQSVSASTPGAALSFQADLSDGTGHITLVWMGRDRVPGISPGVIMRVYGRTAQLGKELVMYNPRYVVEAPHTKG